MTERENLGLLPRLAAFGIDLVWLVAAAWPWLWWAGFTLKGLAGVALLTLGVLPCWRWMGGTPGQLLLSQRVVSDNGAPRLPWLRALLRWAAGWLALAPLGWGLGWMLVDREGRAWHDRVSGTQVVDGDPGVARTRVLRQHLAGEFPLAQSLWMHALLVPLPLALWLGGVDAWVRLHGSGLWIDAVLMLLGWPLVLAIVAWGVVGTWRSAGWRLRGRPVERLQALAVRAGAVLLAVAALALVGVQAGPRVWPWLQQLVGRDPAGEGTVQVSADGRRLQLRGPLSWGLARKVQAAMAAAPQLRLVTLESSGGRLDEALRIAALVRHRNLPTRAIGACDGLCPLVFLAGSQRQLLPGARLGLQRQAAGDFNPPYQAMVNRDFARVLSAYGFAPHLVTKTLATPPPALWFPERDELAASGLISRPTRPLDVDLPAPQGALLADYAEALLASPLWQALEQRFPGAQAMAAQRMFEASPQGAEAVQAAGYEVVAAQMPGLLAQASPETRWLFTEVLQAQMAALAAQDAAWCRDLLRGDAAAHRRLPPALAWREAEWLLLALQEAPRAAATRKPNALELEVIRRTLGQRAPLLLMQLWRSADALPPEEPDCARGQAMLAELGSLAAPQRRLALRLIYERD